MTETENKNFYFSDNESEQSMIDLSKPIGLQLDIKRQIEQGQAEQAMIDLSQPITLVKSTNKSSFKQKEFKNIETTLEMELRETLKKTRESFKDQPDLRCAVRNLFQSYHNQVKLQHTVPEKKEKDKVVATHPKLGLLLPQPQQQMKESRQQIDVDESDVEKTQSFPESSTSTWYNNSSIAQLDQNIRQAKSKNNQLQEYKFKADTSKLPQNASPEEEIKNKKKLLVAKVLCEKGYGFSLLEDYLKENSVSMKFSRQEYVNASMVIAGEVYRRLEFFLGKKCKIKLSPISYAELRSISTLILNCRIYFEREEAQSFFKLLCMIFHFGDTVLTVQEAVNTYVAVMGVLKIKIQDKHVRPLKQRNCHKDGSAIKPEEEANYQFRSLIQKNKYFDLDFVWDKNHEQSFLELYKEGETIYSIREYFIKTYPHLQEYFTLRALRSKIAKYIRQLLKKVYLLYLQTPQGDLPKLAKITHQRTTYIQRTREAYPLRLMLIQKVKLEEDKSKSTLKTIIELINNVVEVKEKEKMQVKPYMKKARRKCSNDNSNQHRKRYAEHPLNRKGYSILEPRTDGLGPASMERKPVDLNFKSDLHHPQKKTRGAKKRAQGSQSSSNSSDNVGSNLHKYFDF